MEEHNKDCSIKVEQTETGRAFLQGKSLDLEKIKREMLNGNLGIGDVAEQICIELDEGIQSGKYSQASDLYEKWGQLVAYIADSYFDCHQKGDERYDAADFFERDIESADSLEQIILQRMTEEDLYDAQAINLKAFAERDMYRKLFYSISILIL